MSGSSRLDTPYTTLILRGAAALSSTLTVGDALVAEAGQRLCRGP